MAFPYKHVLLVGATSGIGLAMASRLIKEGVKVTAVGRRAERLEQFVEEHGSNASMAQFDISKVADASAFAADMFKKFSDIDCVFLNAGILGLYQWQKPETVDLQAFLNEIHVNFSSMVALTHAFLPLLQRQQGPTSIIYTSTHVAHVPVFHLSAYSASKAAMSSWLLCMRYQLDNHQGNQVRIVELLPPVVQTELHDSIMGEERGRALGMPVDVFTDQAYKGLCTGEPEVHVGVLGQPGTPESEQLTSWLRVINEKKIAAFMMLSATMRKAMGIWERVEYKDKV